MGREGHWGHCPWRLDHRVRHSTGVPIVLQPTHGRSKEALVQNPGGTNRCFPLAWLIWSRTRREVSQVLALLHGLHDLSPPLGFPEWSGRNPAILYQQQVEEAQQGAKQGSLCRGSSSLTATWIYYPASFTPSANQGCRTIRWRGLSKSHPKNVPKALARPVQAHRGLLYPRASVSYSKHLNALERPSRPRRNAKGIRQAQLEVVPPRKGLLLSVIKSQRSPARMQSTVPYESSMGACTTPITRGSDVSMRRTELQKRSYREECAVQSTQQKSAAWA